MTNCIYWKGNINTYQIRKFKKIIFLQWIANGQPGPVIHHVLNLVAMVRKEKPDTKLRRKKMVDPARDQQVIPNLVF